jgi:hypothetical protein
MQRRGRDPLPGISRRAYAREENLGWMTEWHAKQMAKSWDMQARREYHVDMGLHMGLMTPKNIGEYWYAGTPLSYQTNYGLYPALHQGPRGIHF